MFNEYTDTLLYLLQTEKEIARLPLNNVPHYLYKQEAALRNELREKALQIDEVIKNES